MDIRITLKKSLNQGEARFLLDIDENLNFGDFLAISGKSGAGKTTILRILSGLDTPNSGFVQVGEQVWLDGAFSLPVQKRSIGFVFQDYALFGHLSVWDNIIFGLERKQSTAFARKLAQIMELEGILNRSITQISGGQAQRVALARALVRKPKILLLDEPLSALDSAMRASLQELLMRVHKEFELTSILISHDAAEIVRLASSVWVLERGRVVRRGAPFEIFAHRSLSAKVQLYAEVLRIQQHGFLQIVDVLCDGQVIRILNEIDGAHCENLGENLDVRGAMLGDSGVDSENGAALGGFGADSQNCVQASVGQNGDLGGASVDSQKQALGLNSQTQLGAGADFKTQILNTGLDSQKQILSVGDKVLLVSKAFNPMIIKI